MQEDKISEEAEIFGGKIKVLEETLKVSQNAVRAKCAEIEILKREARTWEEAFDKIIDKLVDKL